MLSSKFLRDIYGCAEGLALLILLSISCARIEPPGGGPLDKTPPQIVAIKPSPSSLRVPVDTKIEITFSEAMNREVSERAIFMSPLFFDYPTFKWSGKTLIMEPPTLLDENATYVVTVGSEAQDAHGNKLGRSVSFVFSTGEIIHSGRIEGVVTGSVYKGVDVWAYLLDTLPIDSFMYRIPDYVTQTDSQGSFELAYLRYGTYLVLAVDDKNRDQFWTPPGERLGIADRLIRLTSDTLVYGPLFLVTGEADTTRPTLKQVVSPNTNTVMIEFSVPTSESRLRWPRCIITAIEDSVPLEVAGILPHPSDPKTVLVVSFALTAGRRYRVRLTELVSAYGTKADSLSGLFVAGGPDTVRPGIAQILPRPKEALPTAEATIKILFTEAIDTTDAAFRFSLVDSAQEKYSFSFKWGFLNQLLLRPDSLPVGRCFLRMRADSITDFAGNPLGDSAILYAYDVISDDLFGQLSGRVEAAIGQPIFVAAWRATGDTVVVRCTESGRFEFRRLLPGSYRLIAFADLNEDGRYSRGLPHPFRFAEPLVCHQDTISIRARWETDIGSIVLK